MKKGKIEYICFGILLGTAAVVMATCIVLAAMPAKRMPKATKYDLECVAGRSRQPLTTCKEKDNNVYIFGTK